MLFNSKPVRATDDSQLIDSLGVEQLEPRLMLAGNVKISVNSSGDVILKGDGSDNYVQVSLVDTGSDGIPDQMLIEGQNSPDGSPTMLNLDGAVASNHVIPLTSTDGRFTLKMGSGDDFVRLNDFDWDGEVLYSPGSGGDSLYVSNSEIGGDFNAKTGKGNDALFFNNTIFQGDLVAKTGGGSDWIALIDVDAFGSKIDYNTGGGADLISFEGTTLNSDVTIKTGGFPDEIYLAGGTTINASFQANLGSFADALKVENGVIFNDLANAEIDASRPGPNFENAFFMEQGVNTAALPGLGSFGLQFTAATGTTITEEFEARLANPASGEGLEIAYLDSLRTGLHRRGFDFSEMALDTTVLSEPYMQSLEAIIVVGFDSGESLERQLYNALFWDDYGS